MSGLVYAAPALIGLILIVRRITNTVSHEPPVTPVDSSDSASASTSPSADPGLDRDKFALDVLKSIRDSAFQRWDKRRGYEWSLSLSIWTALAAFSGIVIGKDFHATNAGLTAGFVAVVGAFIVAFQGFYLWNMFGHTIGDAYVQRWAEHQMENLITKKEGATGVESLREYLEKGHKPYGPHASSHKPSILRKLEPRDLYPPLSRYGIVQIFITFVLVVGAALGVWNSGGAGGTPAPPSSPGVVINSSQTTVTAGTVQTPKAETPAPKQPPPPRQPIPSPNNK